MQTKTELRAFFISEYEEEKAYLEERHRQGWRLLCAWPYVFRFEACEPEEYVYELDFTPMGRSERERYIALCEDYGWEHVMDCLKFSYFRREGAGAMREDERELFSDNESRMDLARRIFRRRMLPLTILLPIALALMVMRVMFGSPLDVLDVALCIVFAVAFAFDVYALARSARGFSRLREKYGPAAPR